MPATALNRRVITAEQSGGKARRLRNPCIRVLHRMNISSLHIEGRDEPIQIFTGDRELSFPGDFASCQAP